MEISDSQRQKPETKSETSCDAKSKLDLTRKSRRANSQGAHCPDWETFKGRERGKGEKEESGREEDVRNEMGEVRVVRGEKGEESRYLS